MFTTIRWLFVLAVLFAVPVSVLAQEETIPVPSAVKTIRDISGNEITVPAVVPDRDSFAFVGTKVVDGPLALFVFITDEGGRVYIEGYAILDVGLTLVLIMWRDGEVFRAAEDRNLRDLESKGLAGVLVLVDPSPAPPEERPLASPVSASI